jgi:hypothetical protein
VRHPNLFVAFVLVYEGVAEEGAEGAANDAGASSILDIRAEVAPAPPHTFANAKAGGIPWTSESFLIPRRPEGQPGFGDGPSHFQSGAAAAARFSLCSTWAEQDFLAPCGCILF